MDVKLYFDVFPGIEVRYAAAYAYPGEKLPYATRYRLEFTVPDPADTDTVHVPVTVVKEKEE